MSNLNFFIQPEPTTIFTNANLNFGYTKDVNKINTKEFLDGSKNVVGFIEKMGKIFAPLKHDMDGNITKITNKYTKDPDAFQYLEDLILFENREGGSVATDALMWLRRGLHYMARLFECILEDLDAGHDQQDLTGYFKVAYKEVLERYHGWLGTQLFNIMCRFAPNREELFHILSMGTHKNEHVIRDMKVFKTNLYFCVQHLIGFYNTNSLEVHTRV